MHILLTGAAGKVGRNLAKYLDASGYQVIAVDIVQHDEILAIDLRDEAAVFKLLKDCAPDLIVHLAAITNLQFCEENKTVSREINYGITAVLTKVCSVFGIRMVFFSSDYVFGKYDQLWEINDIPCPTIQYGKDKLASEELIHKKLPHYAIVRTAQLYGFAGDFVSLVSQSLAANQKFNAFANLINCPTWTGDLFPMVNKIISNNLQGIFHCVGPEAMSRYQYACAIAEVMNFDSSCIQSVNLDFSTDIRPPVVRLSGVFTYEILQFYPRELRDNLLLYFSSLRR